MCRDKSSARRCRLLASGALGLRCPQSGDGLAFHTSGRRSPRSFHAWGHRSRAPRRPAPRTVPQELGDGSVASHSAKKGHGGAGGGWGGWEHDSWGKRGWRRKSDGCFYIQRFRILKSVKRIYIAISFLFFFNFSSRAFS